jgi:DNA-binding transcriptional ArsR family regulator
VTSEQDLSEVLKALANPARLQLMEWLKEPVESFAEFEPIADRETVGVCVTHLQAKSGLAQSTVSSYMTILERAGLVTSTRVGKWTHYRRDEARIAEALDLLGTTI